MGKDDIGSTPSKAQEARAKRYEKDPRKYEKLGEIAREIEEAAHGGLKILYDNGLTAKDICEAIVNIRAQQGHPIPKQKLDGLKVFVDKAVDSFKLNKTYETPHFDPYAQKAARKEKKNKNMENISE